MLKTIIAKQILYRSLLGDAVFLNVPVTVDASIDEGAFDPERDDWSLRADIIGTLEMEVAKKWLRSYESLDEDGNHQRRFHLTKEEVRGIIAALNVSGVEFAALLGTTKGSVSKILKGTMPMNSTAVLLCLRLLTDELRKPGFTRFMLSRAEVLPHDGKKLKPEMDVQVLLKRA